MNYYYGYPPVKVTPPHAVASLVLGMFSTVPFLGLVFAILSLHYGGEATKWQKAYPYHYTTGVQTAGQLFGFFGLVVNLVVVVTVFVGAFL